MNNRGYCIQIVFPKLAHKIANDQDLNLETDEDGSDQKSKLFGKIVYFEKNCVIWIGKPKRKKRNPHLFKIVKTGIFENRILLYLSPSLFVLCIHVCILVCLPLAKNGKVKGENLKLEPYESHTFSGVKQYWWVVQIPTLLSLRFHTFLSIQTWKRQVHTKQYMVHFVRKKEIIQRNDADT